MDFGDLIGNSDAHGLVQAVRQSRLARHASKGGDVPTDRMPTFGEVADERRMEQPAQSPADAAPAQTPESVISQIAFVVDVKSGSFKPVLPGEPEPQPGPNDIVLKMSPDGQPNIVAQGKRVRPQDIARLQDPKRGVTPKLAPDYQVPPQYEGLAKALGLEQGEGEGPGAETIAGSPAPVTKHPDEEVVR